MKIQNRMVDSDMEKKDWHGLMEILWLEHIRDGKVINRQGNIKNVLHFLGEAFLLNCLFVGAPVPSQYYLGLDARATLNVSDTMENVYNEPFVNGYTRQAVSSSNGFSLSVVNGVHQAASQIVSFSAAGGSWGPMFNIFLSDQPNNSGTLISSAPLTNPVTVQSGDSVNMRMALSLRYYPSS